MRIYILILLALFLTSQVSFSQKPEKDANSQTIEEIIEDIASNTDKDLDYTQLFEDLNYFINNPLNINTATKAEFEKLQILNEFQISSILSYIEKNGKLATIYELQLIYGLPIDDIMKILPFVNVEDVDATPAFSLKKALKYGSDQVILRMQQEGEKENGYSEISDSALYAKPNSRYLGSPQKYYIRYKYNYKNRIDWGVTAEKDAGEVFFRDNVRDTLKNMDFYKKVSNGFDYYTFHLQISKLWYFKTIVLGDYNAQFGQGLTMLSGMGYGKSASVMNIKKGGQGLKQYSSVDENMFMRGAGTTVRINNLDISAFYSKKKVDANIAVLDTVEEEVRVVTSLQTTGLHSTPSEIADKDAISQTVIGGNISYNQKYFRLGLTGLHYYMSSDLVRQLSPYNQFEWNSSKNSNAGFDYQVSFRNLSFFGEIAMSENKGLAYLNGAMFRLAPQISLSVLHRNYDRDYQAYYGGAFGENSLNANENGLFTGVVILPYKGWKISAYYDAFRFPWLRNGADAPSNGVDYLIQVDFAPSRNVLMYAKIKQKIKPANYTDPASLIDYTENVSNLNLRYNISYQISSRVTLKNRIEYVKYQAGKNKPEEGVLIYQDISYKPKKLPLSLSFRYAVFNTDSYNSRIYTYESDILYASSIPACYSQGMRTYIVLKYSITKFIDVWFRYAQTYSSNISSTGSGLTEVQGNRKSDFKVQLRVRF